MIEKQMRELWEMRFLKILEEEKAASRFYKQLLKRNRELLSSFGADAILQQIVRDELKHERVARELVRIVRQKKMGVTETISKTRMSPRESQPEQVVQHACEKKVRTAMSIEHFKAKDIMQHEVVTVPASMPVSELARLFEAKHITGVPVVDDFGKLIGVVSETDLVHINTHRDREREEVHPYFKEFENEGVWAEDTDFEDLARPSEETVDDIMTPWTYSAPVEASVVEVAGLMIKYGVHRVIIVDDSSQVKGIVTTMDIARAVARLYGESPREH